MWDRAKRDQEGPGLIKITNEHLDGEVLTAQVRSETQKAPRQGQ